MTKKRLPKFDYLPVRPLHYGGKTMAQYNKTLHPEMAERLTMLGNSEKDIADFFGITLDELKSWKTLYPDFKNGIEQGGIFADASVTKKLFDRTQGVKIRKQKIDKANRVVDLEEEVPPDVNACLSWLERRRREQWGKEVTIKGDKENPLAFIMDSIDNDMFDASVLPSEVENLDHIDE